MEGSTAILSSIEVLPVHGGRRRWPEELKARIVKDVHAYSIADLGRRLTGLAARVPHDGSDFGQA